MKLVQKAIYAVAGLAIAGASLPAAAAYPERPVKLIVPWSAGGFADLLARLVAEKMGPSLGQSVVVENRAGANGMIGTESVARATPDGYTIMLTGVDSHVINPALYGKIQYNVEKDFAPIGMIVNLPMILSSSTKSPNKVESFKELLEAGKTRKANLTYGSWGEGSSGQLAMEMINNPAKLNMVHVPYKGASGAINDAVAGHIDLTFVTWLSGEQHLKVGNLKALAVTSNKRLATLPDVPTVSEAGLPGYEATMFYGLAAPQGTPKDVIDKLNAALQDVLKDEAFVKRVSLSGCAVIGGTADEAKAYVDKDKQAWHNIIKSLGLQGKF